MYGCVAVCGTVLLTVWPVSRQSVVGVCDSGAAVWPVSLQSVVGVCV